MVLDREMFDLIEEKIGVTEEKGKENQTRDPKGKACLAHLVDF